jgi:hypothetical protein
LREPRTTLARGTAKCTAHELENTITCDISARKFSPDTTMREPVHGKAGCLLCDGTTREMRCFLRLILGLILGLIWRAAMAPVERL